MHRTVSLSLAIAVCLAAKALAVPTIIVGPGGVNVPYELPHGVVNNQIQILVTGGDQVSGLNLIAQIVSGQPYLQITAVDIVNGTFFGNNRQGTAQNFGPALPSDKIAYSNTTLNGTEPAGGGPNGDVLATLTINTYGVPVGGPYPLILSNVPGLGGTDFADNNEFGEPVIPNITDGWILIVPEPGSIVLGAFAAAGLATVVFRRNRVRKAA